jgi:hypothetical protein
VITTKVKTAIFNDPTLKVNEINVETFKGVVQLSGFVRSQADIDQTVKVARGVAGVRAVRQERHADQVPAGRAVLELLTTHTTGACWAAAQTASCAPHHASGRDR